MGSIQTWFGSFSWGKHSLIGNSSGSSDTSKNVGASSMRIPLARLKQSIENYRNGVKEAEYTIPQRVVMQQLYNDLIDEPHLSACMERRMDLTLLRDYIIDCGNDKDTEAWTEWLKNSPWFIDFQRYILMARFRGYSLVSLGNIVSNETIVNGLPELKMLEHSQTSPDRRNFVPIVYGLSGLSWDDPKYKDWHIYVDTPPEIGNACCGYGILHKIAISAIILRSNISDWANFNEKFGQPVVWGKTTKQEDERTAFFTELKGMGTSATFVTDPGDELEFLEAKSAGQGYKTFEVLKMACEKLISKNILGHADVMDSIPKRSGGSSGDSNPSTPSTPVQDALADITSKDGKFITPFIQELLRKMQLHGVNLPLNFKFSYKNDEEEELAKQKEYTSISTYAGIAKTMKDAGLQMDAATFSKETGVPCKVIEVPKPEPFNPLANKPEPLPTEVKNKLNLLYKKHRH